MESWESLTKIVVQTVMTGPSTSSTHVLQTAMTDLLTSSTTILVQTVMTGPLTSSTTILVQTVMTGPLTSSTAIIVQTVMTGPPTSPTHDFAALETCFDSASFHIHPEVKMIAALACPFYVLFIIALACSFSFHIHSEVKMIVALACLFFHGHFTFTPRLK